MAESPLLPIHFLDTFLETVPAELRDIILELRNIVAQVAPDAVEVIRWGGLMYHHAGRGGIVSAGICGIHVVENQVRLELIHGAFLPDPSGLLEGDRKAKRFVLISCYDKAPWDDLIALILASSQFTPRSLSDSN